MSRLKTLIKTTAMTFTAAAVLATSAGLAANALPPESKGGALEEVGQGYHLHIDDDLVWFGGLKNPEGHDPLIWSTIFTNKIPYDSQGYFLNNVNVDNHQDPKLSLTGTQMGWILATYESVNTAQSRAAISLLNRLNFDASAYALDPSHDPNSELLRPARERAAKATAAMQQEHPDVMELAKKYANQAVNAAPEKFDSLTVQGAGTPEGTINLRYINALGKASKGLKATATLDGPAIFKDSGTKTWQGESTSEGFQIPWKATGVGTVKAEIEIMTGYYSLIINVDENGLTSVRTGPGKDADKAIQRQKIEFDTTEPEPTPPETEPTTQPTTEVTTETTTETTTEATTDATTEPTTQPTTEVTTEATTETTTKATTVGSEPSTEETSEATTVPSPATEPTHPAESETTTASPSTTATTSGSANNAASQPLAQTGTSTAMLGGAAALLAAGGTIALASKRREN